MSNAILAHLANVFKHFSIIMPANWIWGQIYCLGNLKYAVFFKFQTSTNAFDEIHVNTQCLFGMVRYKTYQLYL